MNKRLMAITGVLLIALLVLSGSVLARRGPGHPGRGMGMTVGEGIPEALGLSIDDYIKARREGKSISELAEAQGLTLDDLKAKLVEEQRTFVEEELAAGRISEAKAAYMLEVMEEQVDLCLQDGEAGPLGRCPYWGAGPRGGRGGRW